MDKKNISIKILIGMMLIFVLSSCSNKKILKTALDEPTEKKEDKKVEESKKEQTDRKSSVDEILAEKGYNKRFYLNKPIQGLSENLRDMQFAFNNEVIKPLGMKLKDFRKDLNFKEKKELKKIEAGRSAEVVVLNKSGEEAYFVEVQNQTREEIDIDEGIIVTFGMQDAYNPNKIDMGGYESEVMDGFVLPKGLGFGDEITKLEKLYGKADLIADDELGFGKEYTYFTKDKKASITIIPMMENVAGFVMRSLETPKFVSEIYKLKEINDYSKEINKDTFLNIAGKKVKLNNSLKDVIAQLDLAPNFPKDQAFDPKTEVIEANQEKTYHGKYKGFNNYRISLRVVNLSDSPIKAEDGKVLGIRVENVNVVNLKVSKIQFYGKMPYQSHKSISYEDDFKLPVTGPFNIKMSGKVKEELEKAPADENLVEKAYPETKGGYITYNKDNYTYQVISRPNPEGVEVVDSILFNVIDLNQFE